MSIATVNNGELTPLAVGNTKIVASTWDGLISDTAEIIVAEKIPAGWESMDIGAVGAPGSAGFNNNSFVIQGSGYDIEENMDEFRFVYQSKSGDFAITAKVDSMTNPHISAKAGVMIREDLSADSRMAYMPLTHYGTFFQRRAGKGGVSQETPVDYTILPPYWVKVLRLGNTFEGFTSPDGITWTSYGSFSINMAQNVYAGLAVTSHNDGQICTAFLDNVSIKDTTIVGIQENNLNKTIKLYPNPSHQQNV